jgi:hypothetical protein
MQLKLLDLIDEAGIQTQGYRSYEPDSYLVTGEAGLKKFAELIVRECAAYAYPYDTDRNAMLKFFHFPSWWKETTKKENIASNLEALKKAGWSEKAFYIPKEYK